MATFTDNFALVKPTYGELADVAVINGNMDTIDGIMHSNRTMLAPAFSQTEDYAEGDVVVYEGNLYRFIVPHTAGNWDGTEVEQTTLGEEVATNGGADVTKTASGNPITFDDGASAPLVKCVTEIQGSQDLHGQDKPWVGGAGKNKFDKTTYTFTSEKYVSLSTGNIGTNSSYACTESYIPCSDLAGQTITLNHIPGGAQPGMAFYDSNNEYINGGKGDAIAVPSNAVSYRFTVPIEYASGDDVQIEIGSTATAYEPYSNICPISGYSSVGVNVVGKNMYTTKYEGRTNGGITFTVTDGIISIQGTAGSNNAWAVSDASITSDKCINFPAGTYTLKATGVDYVRFYFREFNGSALGYSSKTEDFTVTLEEDTLVYVNVRVGNGYSDNTAVPLNIQIESGSTATEYEPYNPDSKTYTISLGGTYYSGQIDVVKGVLVADKMGEIFDGSSDEGWTSNYGLMFTTRNSSLYSIGKKTIISNFFETLPCTNQWATVTKGKITITQNSRITVNHNTEAGAEESLSDFLTWLASNNLQVVYELATPLEIPLTSTVISSLLGNNTMWTDGDNLEIEYITQEYQPLVDLIGNAITTPILDYDNAVDLTLPDATGYTYIMPSDGVIMSTSYGSVGSTRIIYNGIEISQAYIGDSWTTQYTPFGRGTEITIKRGASEIQYVSGSWIKFIPYKNGVGGSTLQTTTTPTRSLNLTKSAVTDGIPDEIKNAEFEEKPETNEADDDAPTEVDER